MKLRGNKIDLVKVSRRQTNAWLVTVNNSPAEHQRWVMGTKNVLTVSLRTNRSRSRAVSINARIGTRERFLCRHIFTLFIRENHSRRIVPVVYPRTYNLTKIQQELFLHRYTMLLIICMAFVVVYYVNAVILKKPIPNIHVILITGF